MLMQLPESSTSISSSSSSRPGSHNRRPQTASTHPQRPITFTHRRQASGSALTIQTQFNKQINQQSHSAAQEFPSNTRFSYMLNSVLGSPFLTTADIVQPPSHFSLDNNEAETGGTVWQRPPSPSPTADFSIINADDLDGDNSLISRIPGGFPYHHRRSSSSFTGIGIPSPGSWSNSQGRSHYVVHASGTTPFASLNHPTESTSMPSMPQPSNPFKGILPRLWDALSSPGRVFSGNNYNISSPSSSSTSINSSPASSPRIFSHSISLPTGLFGSQTPSGRQSPLPWASSTRSQNKGKGRARPPLYSPFVSEPAEDVDFSELLPLDGEEGELIDEACFVDVRAITGVDILQLLPPELAIYVLQLVCPFPMLYNKHTGWTRLDPLSDETEEEADVALRAILACLAVSRTWRRLASDNSVWHMLFLGRWDVDLRKADSSHMWKPGSTTLVNYVNSPSPSNLLKRHRWKIKPKTQAFKFRASSRCSTSSRTCLESPSSPLSEPVSPRQPNQNYPLQFDWMKLYKERYEMEKRWRGTARIQIPTPSPIQPQCTRETSRSMSSRRGLRSRSLSPSRLFSSRHYSWSIVSNVSVEQSADLPTGMGVASVTTGSAGIPSSKSEPVRMSALYQEQKWEPEIRELWGHTDSVYCVEFDSKRIITGSRDRTIMVWSLKTGRLLGTFVGAHTGSVLCLKFERDWDLDDHYSSGSLQGSLYNGTSLWTGEDDMETDMAGTTFERPGRTGFMFTGSSDCTICVWRLETGGTLGEDMGAEGAADVDRQVFAEPVSVLKGHTGGVLDLRIDKHWIVSCSKDTVIRVWDRRTLTLHRILRGHEGPVNAIGLQNGRVVSASGDGKMILWDIVSGERLRTFDGSDRGLACIDFKNDLIISGSNECKIRIWNAQTGECLRTLPGHNALVRAISFDPKTGRLLSASYDKVVKVWDVYSGKLLREFKYTHTSHIFDVKFDLGRIVSASHDQKICVLDFTTDLDASVFI